MYSDAAGYGKKDLFSERSTAGFVCDEPVYQYAAWFCRDFSGAAVCRVSAAPGATALSAGDYDCGIYTGAWLYDGNECGHGLRTGYGIYSWDRRHGMAVSDAGYVQCGSGAGACAVDIFGQSDVLCNYRIQGYFISGKNTRNGDASASGSDRDRDAGGRLACVPEAAEAFC